MSDKFMDIRTPRKGTRYILVVPRTDLGSVMAGRPAAYIGVDDLVMMQNRRLDPVAYVGRRLTGQTDEAGKPMYEAVIQLPPDAQYQLFLKSDIEFVPQLQMVERHMKYDQEISNLREKFNADPTPPDEEHRGYM
jgi:hypothetical protein